MDLSREDVPEVVHEEIDMLDIIDRSLEQAPDAAATTSSSTSTRRLVRLR